MDMSRFLLLLGYLLLISCKPSNKQQMVTLAKDWIGREITFPQELVFTIQGNDTVFGEKERVYKHKIISYVDTTGCTTCKLQLPRWKKLMKEFGETSSDSVTLYFIFYPKDLEELLYALKFNDFRYPICIDLDDDFNRVNHFHPNPAFQTFLLDKNNRVLAMGNPIHNPKIKELYLKIIQGETVTPEAETPQTLTTFSIDRTSVQMGQFDWQQEQTATFTLTNTGDKPLVIQAVDTSCGCTTVEYSQEPVRPGYSTTLRVVYKAEQPGAFGKTVTVHCNTEDSPLRLTVRGEAV